jgi:hypothetical protein
MASPTITTSGNIISDDFVEILREPEFRHEALRRESFAMPGKTPPKSVDEDMAACYELLRERWEAIRAEVATYDLPTLRSRWIMPLLHALDYDPIYLQANIVVGDGADAPSFNLSHRGGKTENAPITHTVPWGQDLDAKPSSPRGARSPHDTLQRFLNVSSGDHWALLTNGRRLRILRDFHHSLTKGYVECDLEGLLESGDIGDFRALYRLAHASRFMQDEEGLSPLERCHSSSRETGVEVGKKLRNQVKEAIEILGNGFLTGELMARLQQDADACRAYYREILHLIYRLLFLFFVEQKGWAPMRSPLYVESYSVSGLRDRATDPNAARDEHHDLWEGLKITFRLVREGFEFPDGQVPAYGGQLFDDRHFAILNGTPLRNCDLLAAIHRLCLFERQKVLHRINYARLQIDALGSVYESLLDYTPRVLPKPEAIDGRECPAGSFVLDPRGTARKTSGSYYTDRRLVAQLIDSALRPVMADRLVGARSTREKERALLSITVCDPACGSAAFLVAAMDALGEELASVRAGDEQPSDHHLRQAKRDVLQNCIFGVDLNPMAAELAKVSLWIAAAMPDLPLNFLDNHIKCGNSLIGAPLDHRPSEVPDEAFRPVTGDDRRVAQAVRTRNREERSGQKTIDFGPPEPIGAEDAAAYQDMITLPERVPGEVEEKQRKYERWRASEAFRRQKLECDVWCSAFFWPLTNSHGWLPTTANYVRVLREPSSIPPEVREQIEQLAERHGFFHWRLEYPAIFARGGFDCILGNPPWEQVKVNEREWFAGKVAEIADEDSAPARDRKIKALAQTQPALYESWLDALLASENVGKFVRGCQRFPLTGCGDLNTYPLFTEHAFSALSSKSRVGMVVKTGLLVNETWAGFVRRLLQNGHIVHAFDFVNTRGLFPGLAPPERFTLLALTSHGEPTRPTRMAFLCESVDELSEPERVYELSSSEVLAVNPNTGTLPQFCRARDAAVTARIYSRVPVLRHIEPDTNPWGIRYHRMFDMKNDAARFVDNTLEPLLEAGWELGGDGIFRRADERMLPLYEAKLFDCYDHRHGTFEGVPRTRRFVRKATPSRPTAANKTNPCYEVMARYWVHEDDFSEKTRELHWEHDWVFALQDITRSTTMQQSAVGTIVPWSPLSNACPALLFDTEDRPRTALLFAAVFTSLPFDYVVRQKLAGAHLNLFVIEQLAAPTPEHFDRPFRIDGRDVAAGDLVGQCALELLCVTHSLMPFGRHFGRTDPYAWDEEHRFRLRRAVDALMANLYGMSRDEFDYALSVFRIINEQDMKHHGRLRTWEMCLEYYDCIQRGEMLPDMVPTPPLRL